MTLLVIVAFVVIIFSIMAYKFLNYRNQNELTTDESSESEDELRTRENDNKFVHNYSDIQKIQLDTDAVNPERKLPRDSPVGLTQVELKYIEENLDDFEKVSLLFLLSDKPDDCLDGCRLSKWAEKEMVMSRHWEEKLWEALTVIKNFQLPKMFGLLKEDLEQEYFPYNYSITKRISKFRKILYLICESLNEANEKLFVQELQKDLERRNVCLPKFSQLEMYFSYLLQTGYLAHDNILGCATILKKLDFEEALDLLQNINLNNLYKETLRNSESLNSLCSSNITSDEIYHHNKPVAIAYNESVQDNAPNKVNNSSDDVYRMNGQRICLIINQRNFHSAIEEKYQHLLPPNNEEEKLNTRHGTDYDKDRLKSVLKKRKFEVTEKTNLKHIETIEALEDFVRNIDVRLCVCLFVIILSHGNKGVVYCANSCYIKISKIVDIMSDKKLLNIPKVLILQTCQGPILQVADENLTTDGDSSCNDSDDPKTPNFLIFSSTVPGFASIRDKKKGSWFIQVLCDQIEASADRKHFLDICTKVTDEVANKSWEKDGKKYYMVSYRRDTFRKQLFL